MALALGLIALLAFAALGLPGGAPGGVPRASGASGGGVSAQTDDSLPARNVTMIGSSPAEAPGETWGIGEIGEEGATTHAIVRYTASSGWTLASAPLDHSGRPLTGFEPAPSVLTGEVTANGSGVVVADESARPTNQVVLVRDPGGAFTETAPLPAEGEGALGPEEVLFTTRRAPLLVALEEGPHAGALVVPVDTGEGGVERRVLHWNGVAWTSEPIEIPPQSSEEGGFRVLAIGASSPSNAWLLAQLSAHSRSVALFHRAAGVWKKASGALEANGAVFSVLGAGEPPTNKAQTLTVTSQGVWVDGERIDVPTPVTLFVEPHGETGAVKASWCGSVPEGHQPCDHQFEGESGIELPLGPSRSFAWANESSSTPFGERVITGLREGVSLRLEGESFTRVLSLGGSEAPDDVGGSLGAAFSSPTEGWLGNEFLPVHLTQSPLPARLQSYPVPFRHALTAVAPQPGAPAGGLSSEALAVGDQGEVARYIPGEGWQPETLFGPGGRVERPLLRAVAWPTPTRAYAVGELGQMWLWRGETGLWEQDPAAPINFRGNMLGIAFDRNDPSRGYAVGQQGVLLRFGKTWTQDALPSEVAGASFTSIAFAGSEAIVAFRVAHPQGHGEAAHYTGGLLVNEGSGWHVDASASQALGSEVPWAVAGLPDGGAALSATEGGLQGTSLVLERDGQSAPWAAAPPYPGLEPPGSLALFREGGSLRAIGSGGFPNTLQADTPRPPPVGFPPDLIGPYPISTGYVVRQTAGGWSDEEHERNAAKDPPGEYHAYDTVYQPDPTSAVLVDETGSQGWAVGGIIDPSSSGRLDTADVSRYPAGGGAPPGAGVSPVPTSPEAATFAIGGGAPCLAPCADRANARIGPDAWLSRALEQARTTSGVRAFLYTGPRVTTGIGHGLFAVPWRREFERYAELLGGGCSTFAAEAPTDLGPGNAVAFEAAFSGFSPPLGAGAGCPGFTPSSASHPPGSVYYAFDSSGTGGTVRVIVLDESHEVAAQQREWLLEQLAGAQAAPGGPIPAIVVGSADLNADIAGGEAWAREVAEVLLAGKASAYFYDAPGENVTLPLKRSQTETSSIPTFGTGTLGYGSTVQAEKQDFVGHAGFLIAEVGAYDPSAGRAPVRSRLMPNVGELAIEAKDGVLVRRSHVALFAALARRPRSGGDAARGSRINESPLYIPIPANCVGARCARAIFPEYTFSSSREDIGDFVEPNLATGDARSVLPDAEGKPIHDSSSALFCAYNAGTTVVTVSAGGLSASLSVTVQAGSVRRPCGTTKLKELPVTQPVAPPPPPSQPPATQPSQTPPPIVPPPPPVAPVPAPHPPAIAPLVLPATPASALIPFVPPPPPTPARPTPPSGMSQVVQHEEEDEEATESVSNQALAYHPAEHEPVPAYILGIVLLAAFAGASARRRPRRGRREVRVAPATLDARARHRPERGVGRSD